MKNCRLYNYLLKVLATIGKELKKLLESVVERLASLTRIPVWVLVEARYFGYSDADLLTSYPIITATDLANAWVYAEAHHEIELAIERNKVA